MDPQSRFSDSCGLSSKRVFMSSEPSVSDCTDLIRPQGNDQGPAFQSFGSATSPISAGHIESPSPRRPVFQKLTDQTLPGPVPHTPGNENLASQKRPYKYFTAEEKVYLVHRGSFIDNAILTREFNQQFFCSRTFPFVYQTLYHLRSDSIKKQEFAELTQSFEWYDRQKNSPSFTQKEKTFIVYQTNHGQRRKEILTAFDRQFSLNLLKSQIENFLKILDNESAQVLLGEAQKHKWFKTAPPPYDSREIKFGTFHWTAEQRAFVMILCDRDAVTRPTILSNLDSRFNRNCQLFDLKKLVHHVSIPRVKANLNELTPKYEWWTPEPMPGEKGYEQLQRKIKRDDAQAKHQQKKSGFKLMCLNEEKIKTSAWYTQNLHQDYPNVIIFAEFFSRTRVSWDYSSGFDCV